MASPSHSNAPLESAEIEQIITELFAKSLHIILEARIPCNPSHNSIGGDTCPSTPSSTSSVSSIRPRDKWFNLALRECPDALENLELWRQSNLELLVVDVILTHRQSSHGVDLDLPSAVDSLLQSSSKKDTCPTTCSSEKEGFIPVVKEKIVERWIVQYENHKSGLHGRDSSSGSKKHTGLSSSTEMSSSCKKVYRRSILLMRSLYATLRLLPAYKVYGDLCSSSQIQPFLLEHRISSFFEPFSRLEDAEMNQLAFTPIETPCGRLSISVLYLPTLDQMCSEPSTPILAQLIPDYVGSPLAEPIKRFPSLPTSESAPSNVPFMRRHSWSYDCTSKPSVSLFPPPYSDSQALHDHHGLPPCPHAHVGDISTKKQILRNISLPHTKTTGAAEFWPSAPVSPAPLSPPCMDYGLKDPVGLPLVGKARGVSNHTLPPPSPRSARDKNYNARDMGYNVSSSSDAKLKQKQDKASSGNLHAFSYGKDDTVSSTARPTAGNLNSRPFSEEYDDSDFPCPFANEDEDIRDAAVGALVRMLKDAPPLRSNANASETAKIPQRPNFNEGVHFCSSGSASCSVQNARGRQGVSASALVRSKTTVDALEELKSYKEMKDLLLGDGCPNSKYFRDSNFDPQKSAYGGPS